MPREYPEYRDVLSGLLEAFPGGAMIRISELARYDGLNPRTVRKIYGLQDGTQFIDIHVLARKKCQLAN